MKDQDPSTNNQPVKLLPLIVRDSLGQIQLVERDGMVATALWELGAVLAGIDIYSPALKNSPRINK